FDPARAMITPSRPGLLPSEVRVKTPPDTAPDPAPPVYPKTFDSDVKPASRHRFRYTSTVPDPATKSGFVNRFSNRVTSAPAASKLGFVNVFTTGRPFGTHVPGSHSDICSPLLRQSV